MSGGEGGAPAPAERVPSRWICIGRSRTLCLPWVNSRQREALDCALQFFVQPGWRRWACRVLVLPGVRDLVATLVKGQDGESLSRFFGNDWDGWQGLHGHCPVLIAVKYGSPGPYQKMSALFVDAGDSTANFVKLALTPQASEMVAREAGWLERLNADAELRGNVPQILQTGRGGNGEAYLMSTVAPHFGVSGSFGAAHH